MFTTVGGIDRVAEEFEVKLKSKFVCKRPLTKVNSAVAGRLVMLQLEGTVPVKVTSSALAGSDATPKVTAPRTPRILGMDERFIDLD